MRTLLRIGAAILSALLLIAGLATAVIVGPDDTVFTKPSAVGRGAEPVITAPDMFGYDNFRLSVRAEAPGGVFVGTAHPVDIADLTRDAAHTTIDRFEPSGVRGKEHDGPPLEVSPRDAEVWTESVHGTGPQTLSMTVNDGASPQFLISPSGEQPATVSLGANVDGAFVVGLLTALLGLALALSVGWGWRRQRRRRGGAAAARDTDPRRAPGSGSTLTRGLATVVIAAVTVPLTGCGSIPRSVDPEVPATKLALSDDEVETVLADYDRRNNAAIALANAPRYSSRGWSAADTGPLLLEDRYRTRWAQVFKDKQRVEPVRHRPGTAYAPSFARYPMFALVGSTARSTGKGRGEESDTIELRVVERSRASAPWLASASVTVLADRLPDAGQVSAATRGDLRRLDKGLAPTLGYLRTGRGLTKPPQGLRGLRRYVEAKKPDYVDRVSVLLQDYDRGTPWARAVRVEDGVLGVKVLHVRVLQYAEPGTTMRWLAPYSRVRGSGDDTYLAIDYQVTLAALVPDDGDPVLLGGRVHEVGG